MPVEAHSRADPVELAMVDLFDLRWHRDGPPHELLARMRAEAPVRWNPRADGTACWTVLSHAEVAQVSRDHETFSSYAGGIFLHPDQVLSLALTRNLLLYMDPPQHTKYRLILQRAFTPHAVRALEPQIRRRVTRTLDRFIETGSADLVAELAVPVPLGVVAELLGVPDSDFDQFLTWTSETEEAVRAPEPEAAVAAFGRLGAYFAELVARQTASSADDTIVAALRDAQVDGRPLNEAEITVFFALLSFAGHDTTRNTTSTGILTLLEHPQALAELKEDPTLIPDAVEEILRYTCVVQWFSRTATARTELGGRTIDEGQRVALWYTSASRDERLFENPQLFDIRRSRADHDAFGGGGRHFCLGAGLARTELRILFEEVVRRLENLRLAGEPERVISHWTNALKTLPVTFAPAPACGVGDA